jgi:nicotinate-nucleotide adenylyltransferase
MKKRIGVFGFGANPPHAIHWALAEQARAQFRLDWVYIIPAGGALDKDELGDAELRWEMTVADCVGKPHFKPLRIEIDRDGPSWTNVTLEELEKMHEGEEVEFFLILGRDRAGNFAKWHLVEEIIKKATVLVAPRNCAHTQVSKSWLERVLPKGTRYGRIKLHASSTWIRQRFASGASVRGIMLDGARKVLESKETRPYGERFPDVTDDEVCISGADKKARKGGRRSARRAP